MAGALFVFGAGKTFWVEGDTGEAGGNSRAVGGRRRWVNALKSGVQMVLLGGAAAAAAAGCVRLGAALNGGG